MGVGVVAVDVGVGVGVVAYLEQSLLLPDKMLILQLVGSQV